MEEAARQGKGQSGQRLGVAVRAEEQANKQVADKVTVTVAVTVYVCVCVC